jgi:hypothetical protein
MKNTMIKMAASIILVLILASCAGQSVETRALSFYRLLSGQNQQDSMVNYLSPAFHDELKKQGRLEIYANLAKALRVTSVKTKELDKKMVHSDRLGEFALTWVEGLPDEPLVGSPPMKWVRVRGKWYLYMGSPEELKAYKEFPSGLRPPTIAPPKASETADKPAKGEEPKPKADAGKKQESAKGETKAKEGEKPKPSGK